MFFGSNLTKKGIFGRKHKKSASSLNCAYLNYSRYQISAQIDKFDFLDQICSRKITSDKNRKSEHHHWTLHIQISIGTKFQLKLIILDQIYQKRVFLVENRKSEHWILHMRIALGTKFHLRLTILMFWAEFVYRGCFSSKTEKSHLRVCPWSFLIILNFFARGLTDIVVFVPS